MFERGVDQAIGLRADTSLAGPAVMPVASPAQPDHAYEMLCTLAAHLREQGRVPVIIDGTAAESLESHANDGHHSGLYQALMDTSVSGLGRPVGGQEWLVMPGAKGLQALQRTAETAGSTVALSRLLSPFASGTLVLLFAPAHEMSLLFSGLNARVMVPVLSHPQSSIDAYSALKQLSVACVTPVLAPMECEAPELPLEQVLGTVVDCVQRHLKFSVETWGEAFWGQRVLECALGRPVSPATHSGLRDPLVAQSSRVQTAASPILWS